MNLVRLINSLSSKPNHTKAELVYTYPGPRPRQFVISRVEQALANVNGLLKVDTPQMDSPTHILDKYKSSSC